MREDFKPLVEKLWSELAKRATAIERWQFKIRKFRKLTKGWSKNIEAEFKNLKRDMMAEFDALDIKAETVELSPEEKSRLTKIKGEMQQLWIREEIKAKQRSRDTYIVEGDRNTAYFHAVANQRRRKTLIHQLEGPHGLVTDSKGMLDVASSFYKELFKFEERERGSPLI